MRISFSAVILNWSSSVRLILLFSSLISAFEFLNSKRVESCFFAWLTAFSSSIEFTSDTMSNDGMGEIVIRPRKIANVRLLVQDGDGTGAGDDGTGVWSGVTSADADEALRG